MNHGCLCCSLLHNVLYSNKNKRENWQPSKKFKAFMLSIKRKTDWKPLITILFNISCQNENKMMLSNSFYFLFQVQNMRSDLTYRFSIVNFSKPDSLYNYGMKPVLYSQIEAERHFVGWSRVGSNIR